MAIVVKEEHNLANWLRSLTQESGILRVVMIVEGVLAIVLLVAGVVFLLTKGSSGLLIFAGVVAFLAAGHWYKQYENYHNAWNVQRGRDGELRNSDRLEKGLDDDYYILNDVNLEFGRKKSQIDHIVVGPNGIFVIETKNWRGSLRGNETDPTWTQTKQDRDGRTLKIQLGNPIVQNKRHVETAESVLRGRGLELDDVFSVVVVSNREIDIDCTTPVLRPGEMAEYISWAKPSRKYSGPEIADAVEAFLPGCRIDRSLRGRER